MCVSVWVFEIHDTETHTNTQREIYKRQQESEGGKADREGYPRFLLITSPSKTEGEAREKDRTREREGKRERERE